MSEPKVKRLKWVGYGEFCKAETILGTAYEIKTGAYPRDGYIMLLNGDIRVFKTLEAAKAAAQEHFETLVKSCLEKRND